PIHFAHRDARDIGQGHRGFTTVGRQEQSLQLQILTDRSSAAEQLISRVRIKTALASKLSRIRWHIRWFRTASCGRFMLLMAKPGSSRNVSLQQPAVMAFFCLKKLIPGAGFGLVRFDPELQRGHAGPIGVWYNQPPGHRLLLRPTDRKNL